MVKEVSIVKKILPDKGAIHFDPSKPSHYDGDDDFELPVDIGKRGKYLIIKSPIVAANTNDISITINDDVLFIHKNSNLDREKVDNYYVKECHWGQISREVKLPLPVDPSSTKAELSNGVLKITLPIIEKKKTKVIKIK